MHLFLYLLWILSPITALEVFFIVSLVPIFCVSCRIFDRIASLKPREAIARASSEALVMSLLIIVFAIIREPFGFLSLSVPGSCQGIFFLIKSNEEGMLPIRLISDSVGALLLLGFAAGLYRYFRSNNAPRETDI